MLPSVIISKGLSFLVAGAAAGSWLTSGALLMLVHKRLGMLNKRQTRQIEQLQQQQKTLETHLLALRQQTAPPINEPVPMRQPVPAAQGTRGALLQDLLHSNLKLQQDIRLSA